MDTLSTELYGLFDFALGDIPWQEFIDHYAEKYNEPQVDGFEQAPTSINYTFAQLIASGGVTTLPSYVSPDSPGYEKALKELSGRTGNIPTQKAYYRLRRKTMLEKLQLIQKFGPAALTPEMQGVFLGLLDESTDGLIKGYYNSLTNQRMQIASTGKFVINSTNNPRGITGVEIGFGIADSHFETLTTTSRWWTNATHIQANEGSASDPILYIKNRVKQIRRTFHYIGPINLEMCKDLFDDLLTHSAVLKRIGYSFYPQSATDVAAISAASSFDTDILTARLNKLCGVTIIPRDTYAYVTAPGTNEDGEKDLVDTEIENFKKENISFLPAGQLGTIQGAEPITFGYADNNVASYDGGRLKLTQRANPETHSLYIESEAVQLCVLEVPQYTFISTVTV